MKRFIVFIMAMFLLTSCGTPSVAEGYETARQSNAFMNINRNGDFYIDNVRLDFTVDAPSDRLSFFDFNSMTSAIVCPRPNCKHDDPETCSAFGMQNHPTIIGDKLYFFATETGWVGDTVITSTKIYRAEIDGTGKTEIDYLENLSVDFYDTVLIKGNTAYFIGKESEFDNTKFVQTGFVKSYMCSFNFETREFKNYGLVIEGYSSNVTLQGEYNGGIYMLCSYTEEAIDWLQDGAMEKLRESTIFENHCFDLESGEITANELPEPLFVGGGFYGYQDGDNAVVLDSVGNKKVYENYELSDMLTAIPINGFVFNIPDMTAIDLENGEVLNLNKDAVGVYDIIIAYIDGEYVVKGEQGGEYRKISETDLFKE